MTAVAGGSAVTLTGRHAIVLGSVQVSRLAADDGIRALLIKGIVLELLGLRKRRGYADIDVIVEPARFDDMIAALQSAGWRERAHLWIFDRVDVHSVTLIHPSWPIDIDVHRNFPGFLAPSPVVFDELWEHRKVIPLAGQTILATDEAASAAVLGLHALRWMHTNRNRSEFAGLVDVLRRDSGLTERLRQLAARTGSSDTLAPLLTELGVDAVGGFPVQASELRAWRRRVSHPSRTGVWFTYLQSLPPQRWPRELATVVWPSAEQYLQEHPDLPRTRRALFIARVRRLRHGTVGLVRVLTTELRQRQ